MSKKDLVCSFCNKNENDVKKLVAGPTSGVLICNECVKFIFTELLGDLEEESEIVPKKQIMEIKKFLEI